MRKVHYYSSGSRYPKCKVDRRVQDVNGNNDVEKVTCRSCIRRLAWERNDPELLAKTLEL